MGGGNLKGVDHVLALSRRLGKTLPQESRIRPSYVLLVTMSGISPELQPTRPVLQVGSWVTPPTERARRTSYVLLVTIDRMSPSLSTWSRPTVWPGNLPLGPHTWA